MNDMFKRFARSNQLTNQVGGPNVRTAIALNDRQVLEAYSNSDDVIEIEIVPLDMYLKGEDIYDFDVDLIVELIPAYAQYEVMYSSPVVAVAEINGEYTVVATTSEMRIF